MQYKYFPHTEKDIKEMLSVIGVNTIDDLFSDIDPSLKGKDFNLPSSMNEIELRKHIFEIAKKNKELNIFRGAGSYNVYVPSIIKPILERQEFLTSYTPYQAEISQGTLQYIFEYQSYICELTGMDVSNASMYDGASASFESIMMACNHTRKKDVIVADTINPNYLEVIKTYSHFHGYNLKFAKSKDYVLDTKDVLDKINDNVACLVCQYPNFYGYLEDYDFVAKLKEKKILFILIGAPSNYAYLKSPRELGADIACGDCQTLGISMSFGGPYIGYIACVNELLRKLPGRIVGMTNDVDGKRGYVLTLQAREQHIRREKATSNICSNESLMALNVCVYCACMGKKGMYEVSDIRFQKAHILHDELLKHGFKDVNNNEFFNEFVLEYNGDLKKLEKKLEKLGYLGGLVIDNNKMLFCATEMNTLDEIISFSKLFDTKEAK